MQDAVGNAGLGHSLAHVVGILYGLRIAQCNGCLNGPRFAVDGETQPVESVLFRFGGRFILGFDDHGGTARRGNEHVGMAARVVGEGLGILGEDLATGHHAAKQVSQGAIGVWLGLSGHVIQQPNRSIPGQLSNPTSKFRMRLNSRLHDG